jgi:energy-coupling factor transporter ATP-binding protein EcfA2
MLDKIQTVFQLPITYNQNYLLDNSIIQDLELINTFDQGPDKDKELSIYHHVFSPDNCFGEIMLESFTKNYTNDISYLKDTQLMIKNYNKLDQDKRIDSYKFQEILNSWNEIKNETSFCEKYLFIDWQHAKFLNNNPIFLQIMSLYSITSPLLSLFIPIYILIIPFFIIKLKGLDISINEYILILKTIMANHAIGKIFTQFNDIDNYQKLYLISSAAFYIFSIYQNILICIRFYSNTKKIHDYLFKFNNYLTFTLLSMDSYLKLTNNLTTYQSFNNDLLKHKTVLQEIKNKFDIISPFKLNLSKICEIGSILHTFYQLYDNKIYNQSFLYSFGFNGYINNLEGLCNNISNKQIHFAKFYKNKNKNKNKGNTEKKIKSTSFTNAYYPNLINNKPVKNSYDINTNYIITGPNASGKTTLLKTTLINIILSQQFGCGCYLKASIIPYNKIHCYLNIPDTSGRDSLFQAEARRCKEIINSIQEFSDEKHFCIFDEIYSGTNPDEAIISATAFIEYIINKPNVHFMLTTHYTKICKQLNNYEGVMNYNMKTILTNNKIEYTYLLEKGISEIKGGFKVLYDMNYPKEITNKINQYNSFS